MRRVVSLYLPSWPTDRIRKKAGAPPRDKPLVTARRDGARRVIAAVDAAAGRLGLKPGLTIAHAQALVPDLTIVDATPDADLAGLVRLAVWCMGYSPVVALDAPDGLFIEVAGSTHLFGGEAALLSDLLSRIDRQSIAARAALADTPGAAWAVARCGAEPIVPRGRNAAALASLPVGALRLSAEIVEALQTLGVERIGQLAAMPRAPLIKRFGPEVTRRLDQAFGHQAEPLDPLVPPETIARRMAFAEPLGDPDDLARVAARLASELCEELRKAGLGARRVDLLFRRVDRATEAATASLARPSRDPGHISRLLKDKLDIIDPGFGIDEAVIIATRVEPLSERQLQAQGLDGADEDEADLDELMDRLTARLGKERVFRIAPVESDIPERSVTRIPPQASAAGATWPKGLPRPSILLDPPEPMLAWAVAPDNPPHVIEWRKTRHKVRRADGPERVHGEWWVSADEVSLTRDYYRVETEHGRRLWIYRDGPAGQGGRWWLHGFFG